MKIKLFNRGKGWYISCTNRDDKEDKAYINVHFTEGAGKPEAVLNDKGYAEIDIDPQEAKFTSYKGKPGLCIFKYELLTGDDLSKMGGRYSHSADNIIKTDDLPFDEETPW